MNLISEIDRPQDAATGGRADVAHLWTTNRRSTPTWWPSKSRWRSGWVATWQAARSPRRLDHHAHARSRPGIGRRFPVHRGHYRRAGASGGLVACGAGNVARVNLRPGIEVDLSRLERHFYAASSCGVCGKASLEAVRVYPRNRPAEGRPVVDAAVIHRLPATLRAAQAVFDRTGGLHAAALFNVGGDLLCLREDVGRHNALDKLIGAQFLAERTPLSQSVLLVSGRVSFELVQKAAVAGIPILAAVGAPSSLAVSLAREHGLTILGFVREDRFNIYTGSERIRQASGS